MKMKGLKRALLLLFAWFGCLSVWADEGKYVPSVFAQDAQKGDKVAVVMIHFGTTHDDTRAKTIDVLNNDIKKAFPEWDFYEAYTSRIIIRRLAKRGVVKRTPAEVYQDLIAKGYRYVVVQTSNIIDGVEMESVRKEMDAVRGNFKDMRLGNCLLYAPQDYEKVINIITAELPKDKGDIVLVGHGTYTPVTATYAMLDYMLKDKGWNHIHVGTVEGYPKQDEVMKQLHKNKAQRVVLAPLMFVAGEHAKNDIADEWLNDFEKAGFGVETLIRGLGEYPGIRALFIDHLRFITQHREWDILDKKAALLNGSYRKK